MRACQYGRRSALPHLFDLDAAKAMGAQKATDRYSLVRTSTPTGLKCLKNLLGWGKLRSVVNTLTTKRATGEMSLGHKD